MAEEEVTVLVGEQAIRKWAAVKKLSNRTVDMLIDMGFDSMETLSLLTKDDLEHSHIPIGQCKLLLHAVERTFPLGPQAAARQAPIEPIQHVDLQEVKQYFFFL
jgi:hypothetical protein